MFNFAVEVRDENLADLLDTVDALAIAVGNIPTTMVGTNGAALAGTALSTSVWTTGKANFLDAAVSNIPTTMRGTDSAALATEVAKIKTALVNKMIVTEASGAVEQFDSSDTTLGSIATAFASDGTYTTRKRLEI